ncbi:hypothetical protein HO173_004150 [Letharia columbiana]|uniref:MARVEL domain-containing protein n=1 Tax=Letharia columbiana TaxID=112416 RepID=A0A8H6G015_9LECA|nr:uncharacterized protein HO173_004150 [Letharia columbiana]KAF6237949.1 hypothetical protein HO173_004150 [Letharia columbiana]
MFNFNLPLRIFQLILAIIALGLNGHVTSWYLHHTHPSTTPSAPPYLVSVGTSTLLTLPYLFLNPVLAGGNKPNGRFFNKWLILALDSATCLLWFAGFVALAVFHRGLILCGPCDVMVGAVIVGALAWATFLATTLLASLHIMRTRRGSGEQTHAGWVGTQESVQI